MAQSRITRADLEAAYDQVLGEGEVTADETAPKALVIIGAVALTVITIAFLAGKRRGRRKSSVIEIRRL
jgi:hypothetical protein